MSGKLVLVLQTGEIRTVPYAAKGYPELKTLQRSVGDGRVTIERVRVRHEGRIRDAYVDEDGFSKRLLSNAQAYIQYGITIVGNLVVWVPDPRPSVGEKTSRKPRSTKSGKSIKRPARNRS